MAFDSTKPLIQKECPPVASSQSRFSVQKRKRPTALPGPGVRWPHSPRDAWQRGTCGATLVHIAAPTPRSSAHGAIAQLGERVVRNDEVRSSILLGSTTFPPSSSGRQRNEKATQRVAFSLVDARMHGCTLAAQPMRQSMRRPAVERRFRFPFRSHRRFQRAPSPAPSAMGRTSCTRVSKVLPGSSIITSCADCSNHTKCLLGALTVWNQCAASSEDTL
jgi:hypothetical protein